MIKIWKARQYQSDRKTLGSGTIPATGRSGSGSFTSMLTGLLPGTTYYLRAYAANNAGTSYGDELTFTTLDSIETPTVVTGTV